MMIVLRRRVRLADRYGWTAILRADGVADRQIVGFRGHWLLLIPEVIGLTKKSIDLWSSASSTSRAIARFITSEDILTRGWTVSSITSCAGFPDSCGPLPTTGEATK